jgi:hypothetical protein
MHIARLGIRRVPIIFKESNVKLVLFMTVVLVAVLYTAAHVGVAIYAGEAAGWIPPFTLFASGGIAAFLILAIIGCMDALDKRG